jgi:anti-sigma-K factor RskA
MNIKEYISSGILETYLLGGLTEAEADEVEAYVKQYPALRTELDKLEGDLEKIALSYAKAPSPALKSKIASQLDFVEQKEVKVIPIPSFYRLSIAASVALAIVSTASAAYFWNQWQQAEGRVIALELDKSTLANNINLTKQELNKTNHYLSLIQDTSSVLITLKGSALSPNAGAKVLWNKSSKEVYLGGLAALPTPAADQQYQLWAIVDGQPVDAGVFDLENPHVLQQLKTIGKAQAFAVTLEKKGGSLTPTLAALYLIGNV